jgi:hypothetical protein
MAPLASPLASVVDFFIAGVQKGGTTALDAMLRGHPALQMAAKKEVHFFDRDSLDWTAPDYSLLHRHFDWTTPGVTRGESTPVTSYWPGAMERLAAYNPQARIILCLRHPAYRAYSHWRMETWRNREDLSFGAAIRTGRARFTGAHRTFSYVERGFYARQIRHALTLFPRVHVLRTDRLWSHLAVESARLCEFLAVAPFTPERRYIAPYATGPTITLPADDLDYLTGIYADDIRETAALTQLDLDDWHQPIYAEPIGA